MTGSPRDPRARVNQTTFMSNPPTELGCCAHQRSRQALRFYRHGLVTGGGARRRGRRRRRPAENIGSIHRRALHVERPRTHTARAAPDEGAISASAILMSGPWRNLAVVYRSGRLRTPPRWPGAVSVVRPFQAGSSDVGIAWQNLASSTDSSATCACAEQVDRASEIFGQRFPPRTHSAFRRPASERGF